MTKSTVTRVLMAFAAAFVTFSVTACNTTSGAGKDIKEAGEGIHDAAERNK